MPLCNMHPVYSVVGNARVPRDVSDMYTLIVRVCTMQQTRKLLRYLTLCFSVLYDLSANCLIITQENFLA